MSERMNHQSDKALQLCTLGGGCFWCLEAVFQQMLGVSQVESGYSGGRNPNPTYEEVCGGDTGHAEVVRIHFDPTKASFREILEVFFTIHDPTTLNRQGNDVGSQYRSAIFTFNETQKKTAETVKARVNASGKWRRPVVTEITTASIWYPAEAYHQKYLVKNPGGYTCHFLRD